MNEPSVHALIDLVRSKQPEAMATMRQHGYIFNDEGGPWEKLAFSLYVDLCELKNAAENLLEGMARRPHDG